MNHSNYEFQMLYSQEELINKIKDLKSQGYHESDLHVLVRDYSVINLIDDQSDVHTHEANSMGSKFKSMFSGEEAVRSELGKLDLDTETKDAYQRDLENGGILLYTDRRIEGKESHTSNVSSNRYSDEIYTNEVPREEQHSEGIKDSRLKGENIHPTGGGEPKNEGAPAEKIMDHEPALQSTEGQNNLNREEGVNRRQDEQSPGVDPNLGPAPFGRDSEEEHLLNDRQDDVNQQQNPRDARPLHEEAEKKTGTPPTPRIF